MPDLILTPRVVLSYPVLFEAKLRRDAKPDDRPKFSTIALFDHAALDSAEYKAMVAAMAAACADQWTKPVFDRYIAEGTFKNPFRRDIESKGYDAKRFARFISCSSGADYPPLVLGGARGADGKRLPIRDRAEIYPGVVAVLSVVPRPYGGAGTKFAPGCMFDLRNVLKVADGERLAVGSTATGDEFGDVATDTPAAGGAGITAEEAAALLA